MFKNKRLIFLFIIILILISIQVVILINEKKVNAQTTECLTIPNQVCIQCACRRGGGSWAYGPEQCISTDGGQSGTSAAGCRQTSGEASGHACRIKLDTI